MTARFFDSGIEDFIGFLEKSTIAKVLRTIDLLERFGPQLTMPHSKKMDRTLFELRVRWQQEIRIFYVFKRDAAILLHGYVKKSQHIPSKELLNAHRKGDALDRI